MQAGKIQLKKNKNIRAGASFSLFVILRFLVSIFVDQKKKNPNPKQESCGKCYICKYYSSYFVLEMKIRGRMLINIHQPIFLRRPGKTVLRFWYIWT